MYDLVRVHVPARQNTRGVTQAMGSQAVDALCVPIHNRLYVLGNTLLQEQNQRWPTGQSLWHSDLSTMYVLQDILFVVEL